MGGVDDVNTLIADTEITLGKLKTYFHRNGLMLNASKTQCIFIGSRQLMARIQDNTIIQLDGNSITPSKQVKYLGVFLDCHLTFDVHIHELSKKVMGTLMYLNRIKDKFEKTTRILVVQSLVLSLMNYCLKIWGTTNATLLHNVQKLQNFAARVAVGGVGKYEHVTPVITQLKWLKMKEKLFYDIDIAVNVL